MKRQILFRGKRTDNGEWAEGDLIQLDNDVCIADKTMWATEFSRGTVELQCCEVYPASVGQFTGLTDRNGKRIFEGDILKSQYGDKLPYEILFGEFHDDLETEYPLTENVGFYSKSSNGVFGFGKSINGDMNYCEIIGNITDNPELLNPKS